MTDPAISYRLVFDVAERVPAIWLGAAAFLTFALAGVVATLRFDTLLQAWPLYVGVAGGLGGATALLDRVPFLALACLLVAFVSIAELLRDRFAQAVPPQLPRGGAPIMFATFLLLFTGVLGLSSVGAIQLSQELQGGRVDVVEGRVGEFFEVAGGKNECFSLGGRRFCYSDWVGTPGFNRTRALGGPIEPGLQVRLSVVGNTIVRVEVANP
jgi:hypothetical protein